MKHNSDENPHNSSGEQPIQTGIDHLKNIVNKNRLKGTAFHNKRLHQSEIMSFSSREGSPGT